MATRAGARGGGSKAMAAPKPCAKLAAPDASPEAIDPSTWWKAPFLGR